MDSELKQDGGTKDEAVEVVRSHLALPPPATATESPPYTATETRENSESLRSLPPRDLSRLLLHRKYMYGLKTKLHARSSARPIIPAHGQPAY